MSTPAKKTVTAPVNQRDPVALHQNHDLGELLHINREYKEDGAGGGSNRSNTKKSSGIVLPNSTNTMNGFQSNTAQSSNYPFNSQFSSYNGNSLIGGPASYMPFASSQSNNMTNSMANTQLSPGTVNFIRGAVESSNGTFSTFVTGVQTLGNLTGLVDSTVMNVIGLFNGILDVIAKCSMLTDQFSRAMSFYAIYKSIRWLYYKLLRILGIKTQNDVELAWREASAQMPQRRTWYRGLMTVALFSIPVMLYKLAELIGQMSEENTTNNNNNNRVASAAHNHGGVNYPEQNVSNPAVMNNSPYGYGNGSTYGNSYGTGGPYGSAYGSGYGTNYGSVYGTNNGGVFGTNNGIYTTNNGGLMYGTGYNPSTPYNQMNLSVSNPPPTMGLNFPQSHLSVPNIPPVSSAINRNPVNNNNCEDKKAT